MKKLNLFLLLILSIILVGCKKEDVGEEEFKPEKIIAEHEFINDGLISFIKLSSNLYQGENTIDLKHSITAFIHVTKGIYREITYYQFDYVTVDNTYETFYNREFAKPTRFVAHQFLPFVKVSGNAFAEVSGLIKYKTNLSLVIEEKEVKYKETILKFNENDYVNNSTNDDIIEVAIYKFDLDDDYHFKYKIDFKVENEPIHLDMQSWFKTTSGTVYPLMGLYNYATYAEDYLSVSDEIISGIVEIEQIYFKVIYIYNNKTYTLTSIFNVNDLVLLEE